jgi:hypothetical protein
LDCGCAHGTPHATKPMKTSLRNKVMDRARNRPRVETPTQLYSDGTIFYNNQAYRAADFMISRTFSIT